MGAAQLHPSADGVRGQFGGKDILMDLKVAMLLPTRLPPTHIYTFFHSLNQHMTPGQVLALTHETDTNLPPGRAALPSDLHIYLRPLLLASCPLGLMPTNS